MKGSNFAMAVRKVALVAAPLLDAHVAMAGDHLATPPNERWTTECGTCHIAYPPKLLTAPAWRRIMSGLEKHFGSDASMDAQTAAAIGTYLEHNAGAGRRAADNLRITEGAWFQHKHDEVPAAVWKNPAVKTAANCGACHTAADRGDFRKRNIRIPR
jgi:hypothetical protein